MKLILTFLLVILYTSVHAQEKISDYLAERGFEGTNTYAIIIANEDYQSAAKGYIENEELAIYQAEKFQQFLMKTIEIPSANILFYPDAVNTTLKLAIAKLQKTIPENSNLIFYYRGKTFSDPGSGKLFLVPVDVSDNETFFMLGLEDLLKRLGDFKNTETALLIDSSTDRKTGLSSIIENGFSDDEITTASGKSISLLTIKKSQVVPETAKDPVSSKVPGILIADPSLKSSQTSESSIVITGKIISDCPVETIAVNGQEAPSLNNGSFLARIPLQEGENNITIEAKNCSGWTKEILTVTRLADNTGKNEIADSSILVKNDSFKESGKNFAVIIGISRYLDGRMPDLYYPILDARNITNVLINNYTFNKENVFLLENPVKAKIIGLLDSLNNVIKSKDNLMIFYAGHGSWDEKRSTGYWLPSDASPKEIESWIINSIITGYAGKINARHTLVIADACFAGSIFRTRSLNTGEDKTIPELYFKTSKKAMTSGDLTEVPDESVFARNFVLSLTENKQKYLSSEQLFSGLKTKAISGNIIPQFGIIKNAGDEGGDFIFFRRIE